MAADTILGRMAQTVGATEPALRLLISILVGKSCFVLSIFELTFLSGINLKFNSILIAVNNLKLI